MYIGGVKAKKPIKYPKIANRSAELREVSAAKTEEGPMIRTQIYLSKEEHAFVQAEARRSNKPMAAVIRDFIDEKMVVPEDAWTNNPMLRPNEPDPSWEGHEDSGINHDHYLYGAPKKFVKVKGRWVESPPLPDDYYENRKSSETYDKMLRKLDESR